MKTQIGQCIRELRLEKGLRQQDLAEKMCVATTTISSWERANSEPNLAQVLMLSKIFEVSCDFLLGASD